MSGNETPDLRVSQMASAQSRHSPGIRSLNNPLRAKIITTRAHGSERSAKALSPQLAPTCHFSIPAGSLRPASVHKATLRFTIDLRRSKKTPILNSSSDRRVKASEQQVADRHGNSNAIPAWRRIPWKHSQVRNSKQVRRTRLWTSQACLEDVNRLKYLR
ncbi:hypothetical protein MHYP_G00285930 [Metynnis hypsauchen]